jgi:hypothetical protein
MPFTNAAIYFRTESNNSSLVPDPANLPAFQFIHFNTEGLRIEGYQEVEKNNVIDIPSFNSAGTRRSNVEDNGVFPTPITLTGVITATDTTNINKLKGFKKQLQRDVTPDRHIYGVFGIDWPAAPAFSIDPDATQGLTIQSLQWNQNPPNGKAVFTIIFHKHGDDI